LKYAGLDQPEVRGRLMGELARRGVAKERLVIEGGSENLELMARYCDVDLALDTWPYSGGLTTCEALWMGVPVITFPGRSFASRHATSHLSNSGYGQFVANDQTDYVELAVQWASRIDELAAIRAQMRDQVRGSTLCDGPTFAHDLLTLLRQAMQER